VLFGANMSNSAIAAWTALAKGLRTLVDGPTHRHGGNPEYEAAESQFQKAVKHRQVTRAGWKRLILEGKVSRLSACWVGERPGMQPVYHNQAGT
jgi:hypothetical protein